MAKDKGEKPPKYTDLTYGLRMKANAWMFAAFLMGGVAVMLGFAYIGAANSIPVRLIPYNFALGDTEAVVGPEAEETNHYLAHVAIADVNLHSNWTPTSVQRQYQRFLRRLTPAYYAEMQVELFADGERLSRQPETQALFIKQNPVVINGTKVELFGEIKRWQGRTEVLDVRYKFTMEYEFVRGVPYLRRMTKQNAADLGPTG